MASLNRAFLLGKLTRDPDLRNTSGGGVVCSFGLALNRQFVSARGEEKEEVCFVDIETWGKQAETCKTYLRKGAPVFIEGRLRFDQWDDKETGRKRSRLAVVAERVQFLGAPRSDRDVAPEAAEVPDGAMPPPRPVARPAPVHTPQEPPAKEAPTMPAFEVVEEKDEDIPF